VNVFVQGDGQSSSDASPGWEQFGQDIGHYIDARIDQKISRSFKAGGASWNSIHGRTS
jgi:hypothetical protein